MDLRKNKWIVLSLIICCLLITTPVSGASLDNLDELEAFFDGVFAMQQEQYRVPGIAVAVIKDGELWFSKGYGFADLEKSLPMDPSTTLHRPGSNSRSWSGPR